MTLSRGSSADGPTSALTGRTDALCWLLVSEVFDLGRDVREAVREFETVYYRGRAVQLLGDELLDQLEGWLVGVVRDTAR